MIIRSERQAQQIAQGLLALRRENARAANLETARIAGSILLAGVCLRLLLLAAGL